MAVAGTARLASDLLPALLTDLLPEYGHLEAGQAQVLIHPADDGRSREDGSVAWRYGSRKGRGRAGSLVSGAAARPWIDTGYQRCARHPKRL